MKSLSKISIAVYVLVIGFCPALVFAFTAPATGSFAFSVYDLFMNQIMTGAIGFVIAAGLVLYALFWAVRSNFFGTIICAIAAGLIIFIEDVVVSLGVDIADVEAFASKSMF